MKPLHADLNDHHHDKNEGEYGSADEIPKIHGHGNGVPTRFTQSGRKISRVRLLISFPRSQFWEESLTSASLQRSAERLRGPPSLLITNVRLAHSGADIFVAEQLLDFEQTFPTWLSRIVAAL